MRSKLRPRERKGEASLPHQVMFLKEAGIVLTTAGQELDLVSPIQLLCVKIGRRRAIMTVRKRLPTTAWGMMQ